MTAPEKTAEYKSVDKDTVWNPDIKGFLTTLPDKTTVGWDECGLCHKFYTLCRCEGGSRLPRVVLALRKQASSESDSHSIMRDVTTETRAHDQLLTAETPDGGTATLDDAAVEYVCPNDDCGWEIAEGEDPCGHCGTPIDWSDEDEEGDPE